MYPAFPFQIVFQNDQKISDGKVIHMKEFQLIHAEIMMELENFPLCNSLGKIVSSYETH